MKSLFSQIKEISPNMDIEAVSEMLGVDKDVLLTPKANIATKNSFYSLLKEKLLELQLSKTEEQTFIENLGKYIIHCIDEKQKIDSEYIPIYEMLLKDYQDATSLHPVLKRVFHAWGLSAYSKAFRKWKGEYTESSENDLSYLKD
jgi:hypothetical protein